MAHAMRRVPSDVLADAAETLLDAMNAGTIPGAAWTAFLEGCPTAACRALMHRTDVAQPWPEVADTYSQEAAR